MQRAVPRKSVRPTATAVQVAPNVARDRLAALIGFVTILCVGLAFVLAKGTHFLMPGPLSSAHGAIENCSTCHTQSGNDKLSWPHGLIAGDPVADSKACISCHNMPDTAFNAHGAAIDVLNKSTERLGKVTATTPAPFSARLQSATFSMEDTGARGRSCAACHQEHKGPGFSLRQTSNEQCRTCHVVKFDSFDGNHPTFESYPFKKRTPIIYDHASHFTKHFPEVAKKDPARRVPESCSSCHNSRQDKRVMAVAPFEQTCISCHLDQITGKERASGPKGIAFLSLPGLDLLSLAKKIAAFGEWPASYEV
jgi:predicted CXXCH cytochrome family protein